MSAIRQASRIAIIGAGDVGAAVAYALILNTIAAELLLVDVDEVKRNGQVQDLSDATYGMWQFISLRRHFANSS